MGMLLKSYPSLERKLCDFVYPFPDLINYVIVKQKQVNKRVQKVDFSASSWRHYQEYYHNKLCEFI